MYIGDITITDIVFKIHRCEKCNHEFIIPYADDPYCPNCYEVYSRRGSHIERVRKIYDKDKNIIPIEISYSGNEKILFQCKECGHIWKRRVLSDGGCPECAKSKISQTLKNKAPKNVDKYIETVKKINPNIEVIEYSGYKNKVKAKCLECGKEFETDPTKLRRSGTCPNCHPRHKWNKEYTSSIINQQPEIYDFVKGIQPCEKRRFKTSKGWKEVDIFIPNLNIGIEYDSLRDSKAQIEKHNTLLEEHGIRTIHIREDEWENKKPIVKSKIKFLLNVTSRKIYARKCVIKEVKSEIRDKFLESYHIQGKDNSPIIYGLHYNNRLVSIMTFAKARKTMSSSSDI